MADRELNIGFLSTRLAGTDGVSLETAKMAAVCRAMGHAVYYCAGELDADGPPGMLVPEMHFEHPEARAIHDLAFGNPTGSPGLRARIARSAAFLKERLLAFLADYGIDLLVAQNVFAIPMQIPLALAARDALRETGLPAVAHNHDFYWERERFRVNRVGDLLHELFPPSLPTLRHLVINSLAQQDLRTRRNIQALVLPNVFDFDTLAPGIDDYSADLRHALGIPASAALILQPTRVIPRKGIELSIELVARLNAVSGREHLLVITHRAGDEGLDYLQCLQAQAAGAEVDLRYVADRFDSFRGTGPDGRKVYALWDAYPHADFVTYPSLYEGFGNALVETVYFRQPALVNRYPVYAADIGPLGFDFIEIDGRLTDAAVEAVAVVLADPHRRQAMVEHNYALGLRHFSYDVLRRTLEALLDTLF